jgi:hypothetical protein
LIAVLLEELPVSGQTGCVDNMILKSREQKYLQYDNEISRAIKGLAVQAPDAL